MATQQTGNTSTRIVHLEPGMYVIRFDGDPALGESAILSVVPGEPGVEIDFFESEGVRNNSLAASTDCIVARCTGGGGNLLITSVSLSSKTLVGARVDKIDSFQGKVRARAGIARPDAAPAGAAANHLATQVAGSSPLQASQSAAAPEKIQIQGHIEWKGDVTAEPNAWLGDPNSSSRLEGFAVHWHNRPADVDLAYSAVVEGMGRSPAVLSGGFCGSRQRAAAIHGITFSLVGQNASAYNLVVLAAFENTPLQQLPSGIEGRGVTGAEKLVALAAQITRKP